MLLMWMPCSHFVHPLWLAVYSKSHVCIYNFRNKWSSGASRAYNHFTVMVKDNNDKVGCCYIKYTDRGSDGRTMYQHLYTCNYRANNQVRKSTYSSGEPVSQCFKWGLDYQRSDRWSNLCTTTA